MTGHLSSGRVVVLHVSLPIACCVQEHFADSMNMKGAGWASPDLHSLFSQAWKSWVSCAAVSSCLPSTADAMEAKQEGHAIDCHYRARQLQDKLSSIIHLIIHSVAISAECKAGQRPMHAMPDFQVERWPCMFKAGIPGCRTGQDLVLGPTCNSTHHHAGPA